MLLIGLQILCGLLCINNANARTESSTDSHALTGSQEVLQAGESTKSTPDALARLSGVVVDTSTCSGSQSSTYWLDQMDNTGPARGYAPFIPGDYTYPVYRNVKAYNATGDGSTDDTNALQAAMNDDGNGGNRYDDSNKTTRPAEVFVPGGTYMISKPFDLRLFTILVGDPMNPPVIKATSDFTGDALVHGYDIAAGQPTTAFFTAIKNMVIDTTNIPSSKNVTALGWSVSQACHLTNIKITMPTGQNAPTGHTGINMDSGSATLVADVSITGGLVGILNGNQQVNLKNIHFLYCTTAISFIDYSHAVVVQGATFNTCGLCVDASGSDQLGSLVLLDTNATNSGPVLMFFDSSQTNGPRSNQIVIQNLAHSGTNPIAITSSGVTKLASASAVDTWIWGNVEPGNYQTGQTVSTERSPALLNTTSNRFFTMAQPTYQTYTANQVVNVKAVSAYPVKGDGSTDDSASLNAILLQNAAVGVITYVPYGVYILRSPLYVPPGTRMVGEAWSVFSGIGSAFGNSSNPLPVVMIGKIGETGVAQMQDLRFTVANIAPGAIILQVNMNAAKQGDVALWNCHVTVGGFADSNVNYACSGSNTADCLAAFAMVHLSATSSAYIENMWGWTADHSLDDGPVQNIATGRGMLVESCQATWLTGTAFEHNTLYNYNLHSAHYVLAGMQQTETAYWQGRGSQQNAPGPWTVNGQFGDPDFSWCAVNDQSCRMGLAQNIDGGSNLYLYGAAFWTFFQGEVSGCYDSNKCPTNFCNADCIINQARVTNNPQRLYWYGFDTISAQTMILDNANNPQEYNNPGGWTPYGGVIAAYLGFSDQS